MAQADTIPSHADDSDPLETAEWLESLRSVLENQGPERVSFLLAELSEAAHRARGRAAVHRHHALHQHDSAPTSSRPIPAIARSSGASRASSAGTRWPWSCGPTRPRRHRRPHLDVRLGRHAVRSRLQPLLPRQGRRLLAATRSTSRGTPRRASTPGRFSKAGSTEEHLENFRHELAPGGGLS